MASGSALIAEKHGRLSPSTFRAVSFHDNRIRISDEEHHHLVVARAEPGEIIEVFDGKGNVWTVPSKPFAKRETVGVLKDLE